MVASARDIVDASGRVVIRGHGLGGLSGRVPGHDAIRRSVLRGANIFGEPCCVLLRRSALEAVGGWHGDPGYLIDQSTYCRVLLHGDLAIAPGRSPPSGSARPSGAWPSRASRLARPPRCTGRSPSWRPGC